MTELLYFFHLKLKFIQMFLKFGILNDCLDSNFFFFWIIIWCYYCWFWVFFFFKKNKTLFASYFIFLNNFMEKLLYWFYFVSFVLFPMCWYDAVLKIQYGGNWKTINTYTHTNKKPTICISELMNAICICIWINLHPLKLNHHSFRRVN